MRTPSVRPLAFAVVALAATACQPVLFSAEIDAAEVCISGLDVVFPPSGQVATTAQPLSAEDLGSSLADDFEYEIDILEIGLTSRHKDLSTIRRVGVDLTPSDPAAALPALALVDLGPDDAADDGSLRTQPVEPVDITVYVTAGEILFGFRVDDSAANGAWSGTMDLCVHTRAAYARAP